MKALNLVTVYMYNLSNSPFCLTIVNAWNMVPFTLSKDKDVIVLHNIYQIHSR